ncbi:Rhs protein [Streptomyces azureus]|uniref:Rhs protein n=1 Tax=Streptomyces azureus TaxID=146537 RepID=A0A0K8PSA0_STRAJ|nr:Rhs protein [Streptomyces azureus]
MQGQHRPTAYPGGEATGPCEYVGTCIAQAGNVRYENDELGHIALRQKTHCRPKTGHQALRVGCGRPPHWDDDTGRHALALQVRPPCCRTARLRLAENGETAHGALVPLRVHGQTDPALGE